MTPCFHSSDFGGCHGRPVDFQVIFPGREILDPQRRRRTERLLHAFEGSAGKERQEVIDHLESQADSGSFHIREALVRSWVTISPRLVEDELVRQSPPRSLAELDADEQSRVPVAVFRQVDAIVGEADDRCLAARAVTSKVLSKISNRSTNSADRCFATRLMTSR